MPAFDDRSATRFASFDRTVATPTSLFSRTIWAPVDAIDALAVALAPLSYTTTYSAVPFVCCCCCRCDAPAAGAARITASTGTSANHCLRTSPPSKLSVKPRTVNGAASVESRRRPCTHAESRTRFEFRRDATRCHAWLSDRLHALSGLQFTLRDRMMKDV